MWILEIVLTLSSFWIMSLGIYELFAGVVFWEKFLRINISQIGKVIIARLIGMITAILGGIWMFSYRGKLDWGSTGGVLLLLGSFLLLLQSILVIIFGERGMSKKIAELIGSFRDSFYFGEDTYYEMPARIWGLVIFLIFMIVIICIISGINLSR